MTTINSVVGDCFLAMLYWGGFLHAITSDGYISKSQRIARSVLWPMHLGFLLVNLLRMTNWGNPR